MTSSTETKAEPDIAHYHTAGSSLIFVGLLNSVIALYSILQGYTHNSFINYDSMLLFAFSFIAIGFWMRTLKSA
jgi:hypothetical protein